MIGFRRLAALLFAALVLVTGVTGCATRPESSPPPTQADDPASAFPVKVTIPGMEPVAVPQRPKRIVSLSPTATEALYAVGAGKEVVAVDAYSDYPKQAPRTKLSGFTTDAGTLGNYDPDLVIAQDNATELAEGLRSIDVPVMLTPSAKNLDEAYQQIEAIGQATGHSTTAKDLTRRMRTEIDKIVADTPKPSRPLSYFHEVSSDYYTATSESFVGDVYSLFELNNIADPAAGKFPQLSEERILQADPDLIFLADEARVPQVSARPGWGTLTAVRQGQVVALDGDIAARWGPRIVDMVRAVADAVASAQRP